VLHFEQARHAECNRVLLLHMCVCVLLDACVSVYLSV
jgi:hypothetical protein